MWRLPGSAVLLLAGLQRRGQPRLPVEQGAVEEIVLALHNITIRPTNPFRYLIISRGVYIFIKNTHLNSGGGGDISLCTLEEKI